MLQSSYYHNQARKECVHVLNGLNYVYYAFLRLQTSLKLTQYQIIFKQRKTPEDTNTSTGFNDWVRNGFSV